MPTALTINERSYAWSGKHAARVILIAPWMADALYEAGLPPEMPPVVTGWPGDIGDEIILNSDHDLIIFTGGVPMGKMIAAMALSNATPFGLSSGVCTNDWHRIRAYVDGLVVGTVNIWEVPGYRTEMSPFGGIKDSGNGAKEGIIEAMKSFTNIKTFSLPW